MSPCPFNPGLHVHICSRLWRLFVFLHLCVCLFIFLSDFDGFVGKGYLGLGSVSLLPQEEYLCRCISRAAGLRLDGADAPVCVCLCGSVPVSNLYLPICVYLGAVCLACWCGDMCMRAFAYTFIMCVSWMELPAPLHPIHMLKFNPQDFRK